MRVCPAALGPIPVCRRIFVDTLELSLAPGGPAPRRRPWRLCSAPPLAAPRDTTAPDMAGSWSGPGWRIVPGSSAMVWAACHVRVTRRVMAAKAKASRGAAARRRQERQPLGARLGFLGSADPLPGDIRPGGSGPLRARGSSPALAQESVMALGPIPCPYRRTVAMWSADPGMPTAAGSAAPDGQTDGRALPLGQAHGPITAGPLPCRTSWRRNSSRLRPSCDGPRPSAGPLPLRRTDPVRGMGAAAGIRQSLFS